MDGWKLVDGWKYTDSWLHTDISTVVIKLKIQEFE